MKHQQPNLAAASQAAALAWMNTLSEEDLERAYAGDLDMPGPFDESSDDCMACDGTGEGQFDGTSCTVCRGKGWNAYRAADDDIADDFDDMLGQPMQALAGLGVRA